MEVTTLCEYLLVAIFIGFGAWACAMCQWPWLTRRWAHRAKACAARTHAEDSDTVSTSTSGTDVAEGGDQQVGSRLL
ncbi:uncharacterized protein [Dermacentor albipictus]|uniref:uncharacterized protein isoform X3 n=1 Tax=Dermacentor albipictus TaxID=60249 RepID=UPI0038FCF860